MLVKALAEEIAERGEDIKSVASKKTFPAISKAAKQGQVASAIQSRVIKGAVDKSVSKVAFEQHTAINAEILKKGVETTIKNLVIHMVSPSKC